LAGEPARDADDVFEKRVICLDGFHIVEDMDTRPSLLEYCAAKRVCLAHGSDLHTRRFQTDIEPTYAGEKR